MKNDDRLEYFDKNFLTLKRTSNWKLHILFSNSSNLVPFYLPSLLPPRAVNCWFKKKYYIRNSWGRSGRRADTALAFLIGQPSSPTVLAAILQESQEHGDIVLNQIKVARIKITMLEDFSSVAGAEYWFLADFISFSPYLLRDKKILYNMWINCSTVNEKAEEP